jgi:dihydrofolate reductase
MGKVIIGITMSLDGFVNDRVGSVGPLYPDFQELHDTELLKDAIRDTGAVVMGRHAYAMSEDPDWYADNYEFQTPIFVLTHNPPAKHPKETDHLRFTFVTDGITSAIQQARVAAKGKDVTIIGGARTIQQSLNSGLGDELQIDIMPILLGKGLKLFEHIDTENIKLKKIQVIDSTPYRSTFKFHIIK